MREIRKTVDSDLNNGQVTQAEQYMEQNGNSSPAKVIISGN